MVRAQAQGLLVMLTLGVGMFIGAKVAGYIETACTPEEYTVLERAADISTKITQLPRRFMNSSKSIGKSYGESLLSSQPACWCSSLLPSRMILQVGIVPLPNQQTIRMKEKPSRTYASLETINPTEQHVT